MSIPARPAWKRKAVVPAERERDVRDSARDLGAGEVGFDPPGGVDEVDGVIVVLLDAGGDGEDVGVEDDVVGVEADIVDEQPVGAFADADLVLVRRGLSALIERHDDGGGAVAQDGAGLLLEFRLPFLEGDGIGDALSLEEFESGLDDLPFRGIDHDRYPGDLGFGLEEAEEPGHGRDAVDQPLVHADVDDVGAVLDLLAGDGDGLLEAVLLDEAGEFRRAGDVRAFADHEKV
jgi:hypothetical protein